MEKRLTWMCRMSFINDCLNDVRTNDRWSSIRESKECKELYISKEWEAESTRQDDQKKREERIVLLMLMFTRFSDPGGVSSAMMVLEFGRNKEGFCEWEERWKRRRGLTENKHSKELERDQRWHYRAKIPIWLNFKIKASWALESKSNVSEQEEPTDYEIQSWWSRVPSYPKWESWSWRDSWWWTLWLVFKKTKAPECKMRMIEWKARNVWMKKKRMRSNHGLGR